MQSGQFVRAEEAFRQELAADSRHVPTLLGLGMALKYQMRAAEAQGYFESVLAIDPENHAAWLQKAGCLEMANRLEEAQAVISQARARLPNWRPTVLELKLARRTGDAAAALAMMEPIIPVIDTEDHANYQVFFELGYLFDLQGDYQQAFACFSKGNHCMKISPAASRFAESLYPEQIARHRAPFTAAWVRNWTPAPPLDKRGAPVFIVGFPRSGTTLLDHVLHGHPAISVAEELPALYLAIRHAAQFTDAGPYPDCLSTLTPAQIVALRGVYFEALAARGVDLQKPLIVDKHPLNMVEVGMIYRLFPEARIIMVLRHPCDCVLSCFMQYFALNMATVNFLDLATAARLYDKAFSAWEQYRSVLPLAVHTVKYEDLTKDFRPTMQRVVDFLGLPWDETLELHHARARERGVVRTASYAQVSEKLYTRSQYRWRQYAGFMDPAVPTLSPWIEKFGYRGHD